MKEIHLDGALLGFAASTAHAPDIGGRVRSPEAREIFKEGLQIPVLELIAARRPDETLFRILAQRPDPELTAGDFWAQVTALGLMGSRFVALARAIPERVMAMAGSPLGPSPRRGSTKRGSRSRTSSSSTAGWARRRRATVRAA